MDMKLIRRRRAGFSGECSTRGFTDIAGDEPAGSDKAGTNKSPGQRSSHFTRAEKADGELGCHAGVCSRSIRGAEAKSRSRPNRIPLVGIKFGHSE